MTVDAKLTVLTCCTNKPKRMPVAKLFCGCEICFILKQFCIRSICAAWIVNLHLEATLLGLINPVPQPLFVRMMTAKNNLADEFGGDMGQRRVATGTCGLLTYHRSKYHLFESTKLKSTPRTMCACAWKSTFPKIHLKRNWCSAKTAHASLGASRC